MSTSSTLKSMAAVLPLSAAAALAASPEAPAVLQAAQAAARAELKVPLALSPQTTRVSGAWAFVIADLRQPDGKPFDYSGTPQAEAAREGYLSRQCVALLSRRDGQWQVVELRLGATDVVYAGWAAKHHAPAALFSTP
jgi:hypothetical protein